MAKELYHKHSTNVRRNKPLTHSEWSSTTSHRIDDGVTGDLIYLESSTGGFVGLGIGTSGQFLTVSSSGLPEWSSTVSSDRIFEDDIDIELGTGSDTLLRFSTADSDNHATVIGLDDTSQSLHITDKGAVATDWNLSANTHPTLYIHSNTTPATDFLRIGAHDGTNGYIDIVGGTTLHLQVGGADQFTLTASAADFQDNTITTTATITTTSTIELGHASDTTLARSGSGDVTIEGNAIYRALGTDVPVADGGTGASSLTANAVLTGNGTSAIQAETALLFDSNKLIPTAAAHDAAGTALTVSAGSTTAGTSNNQAGASLTLQGGQGKGTGSGGNIVFQTANAATSGSSLNALATALTISDDLSSTFTGAVVVGSDGSGLDVSFHSGTSGDLLFWDASEEVLQITGTNGQTSLDVLDGDLRVVDKIYFFDRGGEYMSSNGSTLAVVGNGTWTGSFDITGAGSTSSTMTVGTDLIVTGGDLTYGNGQAATIAITASAHDAAGQALSIASGNTTAGTSNNQAGGSVTIKAGQGKGSGSGGDIIFQTANAAGSGSSLNALATALTISDDLSSTFGGAVTVGSDGSGKDVIFYSGTSGDNLTWDASEEVLNVTGTNGATSLDVLDGDVRIVDTLYFYDRGGESISSSGSLLTISGISKFSNPVYINETANAGVTMGLTINQGSNTDAILELKGTGVNHDRVGLAEDDTFAQFRQTSGNYGGLTIRSLAEGGPSAPNDIVTQIYSSGGKAATGKNTGGYGLVDIYVEQTQDNSDGTWVTEDIVSNGNIFSIRARVGDANVARWILDAEGDQFVVSVTTSGNSASATAFDAYEDAELIRAYETARTPSELIRSEWDKNVRYNEQNLIDLGILGDTLERGGMTNQSQLIRLHNGAIWQGHVRTKELEQKVATLENKLALIEGTK